MKIRVNGEICEIFAGDLKALLEEMALDDAVVATALNQNFIRAQDRVKTQLRDGDEVEILAPRQGG